MSSTRLPLIPILATMLAIGLWHEITCRYIIWGLLHGVGVAAWYFFNRTAAGKVFIQLGPKRTWPVQIFLTFNYVVLTFVIIMRNYLAEGWEAMKVSLFLN